MKLKQKEKYDILYRGEMSIDPDFWDTLYIKHAKRLYNYTKTYKI